MLKILTEIDKSQGFRKLGDSDFFRLGSPCILSSASNYFELSLSDIVPNVVGFDNVRMPFVFLPTVNLIKVPVAGVSPEISDMIPGILREMQISRILENMDMAIESINSILPDPEPVIDAKNISVRKDCPGYKLTGNLSYYRLDTRYRASKKTQNPWPNLHRINWFGQDLYMCTTIFDDNCYLTVYDNNSYLTNLSPKIIVNQELLIQLINYKYAFKRYGIKTISN